MPQKHAFNLRILKYMLNVFRVDFMTFVLDANIHFRDV